MFRPAWWISLVVGLWSGGSGAEDTEFCQCVDGVCDDAGGDPEQPACIGFEEAADLAKQPGSGVFALTTKSDPQAWGILEAQPANANAICQSGTCYVREDGQVSVSASGNQSVFLSWSGCSDSTQSDIVVGPLSENSECVAHMGPGLIVVHTAVKGRDDAKVQIAGSCTGQGACSFLNGGSVTLSAPASDSRFTFLGWSGCSTSTAPTLSFNDVHQSLPECVAQYAAATLY